MKTPITPIRIPLDLKEKVRERAEKEGTNLSQYIIKLLNESVNPTKCDNCGSEDIGFTEYFCNDCDTYGFFY